MTITVETTVHAPIDAVWRAYTTPNRGRDAPARPPTMYLPPPFEETGVDELHRLVTEYPFGALVINGPAGLDANHLPFVLDTTPGPHGHLLARVTTSTSS